MTTAFSYHSPPPALLLLALTVAFFIIGREYPMTKQFTKPLHALFHESSHAIVAMMCRVNGLTMVVRADGNGYTQYGIGGRYRKLKSVLIAVVGYPGPAILALVIMSIVAAGYPGIAAILMAGVLLALVVASGSVFSRLVSLLSLSVPITALVYPSVGPYLLGTVAAWAASEGIRGTMIAVGHNRREKVTGVENPNYDGTILANRVGGSTGAWTTVIVSIGVMTISVYLAVLLWLGL